MLATLAVALVAVTSASAAPPYDGTSFSPWLGTPGTTWCAGPAPGTNIAQQQGAPLALIPQEAFKCLLDQFEAERVAAGIPDRMDYGLLPEKSSGGRDHLWVVVNALETAGQQLRYQRYLQLRAIEKDQPAVARAMLASFAGEVKMPVFMEANIHGNEEEGADAMMQAIRDLVTLPRGTNPILDKILDYSVLIVIPNMNPDGRFLGTRANQNGFDMNRDFLVQSQPEVRNNVKLQQEWRATNGNALHGYVNPTLVDALTKPHNPGLEYDIFLRWNQPRVDANQVRLDALPTAVPGSTGYGITRPVNEWCAESDEPSPGPNCDNGQPPGPAEAEGWDDWGPFYTQTYISLIGLDGSTVEMCSSTSLTGGCGGEGRLGSKKTQYVTFYSSMEYWLDNRSAMMDDKLEIYERGVTDAARPNCCTDPAIAARGFDEANHNWMIEYPRAYIIPFEGGGQRSDIEANRLVKWLLDNGIEVQRSNAAFTWNGTAYPAGSYIVFMNQAFRGLALTALSAGQDISSRISQLYAPPGAWSHGLMWGADVVEVPRGAAFAPAATEINAPSPMAGGIRGGAAAASDFYSVTLRGTREVSAVLQLLRDGGRGEMAEAPFTSTTGGPMPAGTLIFPNTASNRTALEAAGAAAGIWFERNVGVTKPTTTLVEKAPRIAVLVNATNPTESDQSQSLRAIFGNDVGYVSTVSGSGSLQNAATNPLDAYDVIYNTGQNPGTRQILGQSTTNPANSGATQSGNTVTIRTNGAHGLTAGAPITVTGVGVGGYNGSFTVASTPTTTSFTYANPTTGLTPSGGGYVYSSTLDVQAQSRIDEFFARGGGYIGTSVSGTSFFFLNAAGQNLVNGSLLQTSDDAGGGIALWENVGGPASPITGGYPSRDTFYLPSNMTFFSSVPAGAMVDGRYLNTTDATWVAGLWRDRDPNAANAPVIVHGTTTNVGRYMGLATNPFSRQDAEREWTMIGQAALWTTLTDEADSNVVSPAAGGEYGHGKLAANCASGTICGTASGAPGPAISSVAVAVQQVSSGMWWNGTGFASATPVFENASGGASWTYAFPSTRFTDGDYVVRTRATTVGGNVEISLEDSRFTFDGTAPTVSVTSPANQAYAAGQNVAASYSCSDAGGIQSCTGPVESGQAINTTRPGSYLFTVVAVDEAGNRTSQTVSYTVEGLTCRLTLGAPSLRAGKTTVLRIRVAAFGPNRTPAEPGSVQVRLRGAGVNRVVRTNEAGLATARVRPTRAGTFLAAATRATMETCGRSLKVRAARSGTAGTGTGGLTGRPR